uniref:TolC family protein n=1 Tax=Edaphosphingomonas laterariae TaxID=861865 RepID=UPI001FE40BCF|nr:TolC family protein [Sphingomonas laterariae]
MPDPFHVLTALFVLFSSATIPATSHAKAQDAYPPIVPIATERSTSQPAGAPVPLSLTDAVALALRENRDIRSAYLSRIVQKFDLVVARSDFWPKVGISANVSARRADGTTYADSSVTPRVALRTTTGATVDFTWQRRDRLEPGPHLADETATFLISQPLLRGAGFDVNLAPLRIARLQEQINQLNLKTTVSNIVSAIIVAYRTLVQSQEQVRLAELSLERARDLLTTNRALIAAGRMPAADIVQTESQVANQEVAMLQARQQKISAQLALIQLLALDSRTNILAADAIQASHVDIDMDRLIQLGLSSRMDVLAQSKALEISRQAVSLARNNRLWDLRVTGSITQERGLDTPAGAIDSRTDKAIGIQLGIPISGDLSGRQGEIQATIGLRNAEIAYEGLVQSAELQIRDGVQSVEASWLQLEAARRARALAARALELQQEKLKVGRASNFEVLSFQADLRAADTQELAASIAYLNALTALDQQVGNTLKTWRISLND